VSSRNASSGQHHLVWQIVSRAFERASVFLGGFHELAFAPVIGRACGVHIIDQGCRFMGLTTLERASQALEEVHVSGRVFFD
jgi:hypothetical protein